MPPYQTGERHGFFPRGGRSLLPGLTSARLGGIIVMLGGLIYVAATAFYFVVANTINADSVGFRILIWTYDIMEIFVALSFAVGLVSLYTLLRRRSIF